MKLIIKLFIYTLAVILCTYILPGIHVTTFTDAIIAAAILVVLQAVVKPILTILTFPITIMTLGLFLLVINVFLIYLTEFLVPGFQVDGFWWALFFSILLSLLVSVFEKIAEPPVKMNRRK